MTDANIYLHQTPTLVGLRTFRKTYAPKRYNGFRKLYRKDQGLSRCYIHEISMDATSLYTNIPQEEGITTVCKAYEAFHSNKPPILSHYLKEILELIFQENSFQFVRNCHLQTHGTAMGTKMAVAFANIWPILKQK